MMIANSHLDSGLSIQQVVEQFGQRYGGEHAVREAVNRLVDEGHLYSTIDEDHYKHTG
jgi:replication factor A2